MVDFPYWARIALKWVRPCHGEIAERGSRHRQIRGRFVSNWPVLMRKTWPPLFARAKAAGQDLDDFGSLWGRGGLPALVLEVAYWWANERMENGPATTNVLATADELRRIDRDIIATAERLETLLRRKGEIAEREGLHTEWASPGLSVPALLRETARRFPSFNSRVSAPLDDYVQIASGTSVTKPQLADILAVVCEATPGPVLAMHGDDQASLDLPDRGVSPAGTAASVRRFFGELDNTNMFDSRGRRLRPLDWLSAEGVSTLLSVAAGVDPQNGPINLGQVKKLRSRYKHEAD